jgi:DNA-binding MarR family transcriptional regulator
MSARISYLIKWVERGVRSGLDTALSALNVTTPEYTTLSVLRHRSGLSSAQLARRAFVSAQAMNQLVVSLERYGWI